MGYMAQDGAEKKAGTDGRELGSSYKQAASTQSNPAAEGRVEQY